MIREWTSVALVTALGIACGPQVTPDTRGTGAEDTSGGGSTTSTGGDGFTREEFEALCVAQQDEASCEGIEPMQGVGPTLSISCAWESVIPVEIGENDSCVFGVPSGRCLFDSAGGDSCGSGWGACDGVGGLPFRSVRVSDGGVALIEVRNCAGSADSAPCFFTEDGLPMEGSPTECSCFCDAAYPR